MSKKQKFELTWIGKDEEPRLEPRILIEDSEKSYGEKNTQNMLIHGDNLLAFRDLRRFVPERIKAVFPNLSNGKVAVVLNFMNWRQAFLKKIDMIIG